MTAQSQALHEKIRAAAAEAGYVQKSSRNTGQGYNYAGDEAITEKFREAFLKHGLVAYPDHVEFAGIETLPREGKDTPNVLVHVRGSFVVTDGEDSIMVESLGAGIDVGDKAVYKALTGFRKYAYRNAVMMATGDDPEAARDDEKPRQQSAAQSSSDKPATTDQKKLIRGKAREVGLTDEALGRLRLSVTGKRSTREFTNSDIDKMLEAMKDPAQMVAVQSGGEVVQA